MLGSIGPTELILLLIISIIVGLYYFAYRWSLKRSKKAALGKPFKWFYFYTYIRLPLSVIGNVAYLIALRNIDLVMVGLAIIGIYIAAFIGLSRFRSWALNLNIMLLLGDCYLWYSNFKVKLEAYNGSDLLIMFVIVLLIWFLPNLIYFEKRRRYFSATGIPARAEAGQEADNQEKESGEEKGTD